VAVSGRSGEPWISETDKQPDACFEARCSAVSTTAAKYKSYHVHPQHAAGPISIGGNSSSGFKGSIAHVAIWNRLLSSVEIDSLWIAGQNELRDTPMYHSYT
jgi:hypothetical protein